MKRLSYSRCKFLNYYVVAMQELKVYKTRMLIEIIIIFITSMNWRNGSILHTTLDPS